MIFLFFFFNSPSFFPSLTTAMEYKNKPREGREHQIYTNDGSRLVAGGVILNNDNTKVLMISSSKNQNKWIIPKGGIEDDEINNYLQAARREIWEEAGVIVDDNDIRKLPVLEDSREIIESNDFPKCQFHFYQMKVRQLKDEWPESHCRKRKWFDFAQASVELQKSKRPELLQALQLSDIIKNQ